MGLLSDWLNSIVRSFTGTVDKPSPSDIFVRNGNPMEYLFDPRAFYKDRLGFRVKREFVNIPFANDPVLWPCLIPATKSMDPVFDHSHDNLYMQGATPLDQGVMIDWLADEYFSPPAGEKPRANIIVYRKNDGQLVVHRLEKIEYNGLERRWWFRGDNNATRDPESVGDSQIRWVLAMIAY